MKELHFYIQSIMILFAAAIAVQLPNNEGWFYLPILVQIVLGIYQYGMSWFLQNKLRRAAPLLGIYSLVVNLYLLSLAFLALLPVSLSDLQLKVYLFGVPWIFAIYFLVVIEDLLWVKIRRCEAKNEMGSNQ